MDRMYLDNAATTRLSRRALAAMLPLMEGEQGNPSSLHSYAREARKALERARGQVARCIGADEGEIVFTSGGSEGNNYLLRGAIEANRDRGSHVITSAVEHPSVLNTLRALEKQGRIQLTVLPVDGYGRVSVVDLFAALQPDTVLVSVMLANNEVGTLQPISSIGNLCRERGVLFHVDAVQGAGHLPLDVQALRADMLTLSAHKFHGPRGVGAAYARKGTQVAPLMTGGEQEKHRRAGTENVAGTVGMAEALMEQTEDMEQERERLQSLSEKLIGGILSTVPDCQLTGHRTERLPGVVSFLFEGVSPDELLALLDMQGVAASAGSACTAGSNEPSHVLQAMGLLDGRRCAPLRLSLGRYTKAEEIDRVLDILSKTVARLRG
jgi:cysteine desulfurase